MVGGRGGGSFYLSIFIFNKLQMKYDLWKKWWTTFLQNSLEKVTIKIAFWNFLYEIQDLVLRKWVKIP